jgi:primosomal protein N' (replication factor Y)
VVGEQRTAEELGRAFPGTVVRQSGLGHVLDDIPATPSLVVCTPGAEPVAAGGYAAAVLLDVDASLARADLRAAEECLRRWLNVVSLVRPAGEGGVVLAVGDPAHRAVQALVRLDPAGFAERELADREAAHLPPAWRIAELTGPSGAVDELLDLAAIPPEADVLGPVPVDEDDVRVLVRAPLDESPALTRGLRAAAGVRSARRRTGAVRIRVDPVDVG